MSRPDILARIAARRRERVAAEGAALSALLPQSRETPLRPFLAAPEIICEIKRRSPSAGAIAAIPDPVAHARVYRERGVPSLSVLTEEDHFGGSLGELLAVKRAFPELAVLRKDFLFDAEDVALSYRAGADAVLLIASMLEPAAIAEIFSAAEEFGLAVLAEAHSGEDLEKLAPHRPALVGMNSRDLTTFRMDPLIPLKLAQQVDWECRMVFESGIYRPEQVQTALAAGFSGILVGESVVRKPERIGELIGALEGYYRASVRAGGTVDRKRQIPQEGETGRERPGRGEFFWSRVARAAAAKQPRPLVKICGITREEDARLAVELGADLLGFILAESPRELPGAELEELLLRLSDLSVPRVGVLVARKGREIDAARVELARALLTEGLLSALQLHGDERPEECAALGWPYYKALRPRTAEELERAEAYHSPRILLDGFSATRYGGTGNSVAEEIVDSWRKKHNLWLAGGVTPENVAARILRFQPELLDVAGGVEEAPGVKSAERVTKLFQEIDDATAS
ncbi:MAG: bifunctional indole-3-glycerol phosphate synthase/phosphoribosylanthranilate isomerase [Spirochaetaceae bacterium]